MCVCVCVGGGGEGGLIVCHTQGFIERGEGGVALGFPPQLSTQLAFMSFLCGP